MLKLCVFCVHLSKYRLDRQLPIGTGVELFLLNVSSLKLVEKLKLRGHKEEEGITLGLVASSTANPVDVSIDVLWAVNLNHPVNCGEVNSARTDVRTKEHGIFLLDELKVDSGTLVLLHLSVELHQILAYF